MRKCFDMEIDIMTRCKKKGRNRIWQAGLLGMALGILAFLLVYGVRVLDVTYDGWLFTGGDLQQHYLGSLYYRTTPWTFPIGMMEGLTYDYPISILYTDSVPLFAVISKLFAPILPETFQYFGWFGLLCYSANGALGAVIGRRFTEKPFLYSLTSVFFIFASPVLQRLFGYMDYTGDSRHTALAAHFLVLAALTVWLYRDKFSRTWKSAVIWAVLGGLCIWIQSYFVFMVGGLMLGFLLENLIRNRKWSFVLVTFVSFCASVFGNMFILGAFEGEVSSNAAGFGVFSANINALVNPMGFSKVIPDLAVNQYFQYEGMSYLGLGMLALGILVLVYGIRWTVLHIINGTLKKRCRELLTPERRAGLISAGICFVVFFFLAVSTKITLGKWVLVDIPLLKSVRNFMGIFRSGGRFMWCCMYMVMLGILWVVLNKFPKKAVPWILAAAAGLQIWDLSGVMANLHATYANETEAKIQYLDSAVLEALPDTYSRMLVYDAKMCRQEYYVELGAFGWSRGMDLNYFYLSRQYPKAAKESDAEFETAAAEGTWQKDVLYVINADGVETAVKGRLHLYYCNYVLLGTAEPAAALEWAKVPEEQLYTDDGQIHCKWLYDKLKTGDNAVTAARKHMEIN